MDREPGPEEIAFKVIQVTVHKHGAYVEMDPRRMARNVRRQGKTAAAAGRLAVYKLRRYVEYNRLIRIRPVEVQYMPDLMTNTAIVAATTRCVPYRADFPYLDQEWLAPPESAVVEYVIRTDT